MSKRIDPHCQAYQKAIDLLARPWTALILSLLQAGPLRFSEIEESTRGVGAKTLSARLKELEARGLVARPCACNTPSRGRDAPSSRWPRRSSVGAASWSRRTRRPGSLVAHQQRRIDG